MIYDKKQRFSGKIVICCDIDRAIVCHKKFCHILSYNYGWFFMKQAASHSASCGGEIEGWS
jgi:hypothetical protein